MKSFVSKITDKEAICAIRDRNELICKYFYFECRSYFLAKHNSILSFKSREREILDLYQESFSLLYSEIASKRIDIIQNNIVRKSKSGEYSVMTANLKTYLLSIARIKNLELSHKLDNIPLHECIIPDLLDDVDDADNFNEIYDIINYCVNFKLPDRCKEILTLFYYENRTLDEILLMRKENMSKDGLKTSKYKCMIKLRSNIMEELKRNNITICHGK